MSNPLVRLNIVFNLGNPNIRLKMRERERERERGFERGRENRVAGLLRLDYKFFYYKFCDCIFSLTVHLY